MLASPSLSQKRDVYAVARHNSMLDWTLCCLLQFIIQGKKISLLQTFAMAVYSTIDLVFRMFSPLIFFITLILDLYSGMIQNYSYLLPHSNPPMVQRQLAVLVPEHSNFLLGAQSSQEQSRKTIAQVRTLSLGSLFLKFLPLLPSESDPEEQGLNAVPCR